VADRRLDPLDEIIRMYSLLTASERVQFLAWVASAPSCQKPAKGEHDDAR